MWEQWNWLHTSRSSFLPAEASPEPFEGGRLVPLRNRFGLPHGPLPCRDKGRLKNGNAVEEQVGLSGGTHP